MVLNNTCECMHTLYKNTWTRIYTYIYTYTQVHIYICIHAYIDIYIHTYTYTYVHGYINISIRIHMYIYIYVYIYAYAHMYIFISTTRACAPVQRCNSFLAMEAIANLSWVLREHRAGCRFRPPSYPFVEPAALLLARWPTCSQIHASSWRGCRCSVARASSDHLRWCGPHPVCLWFTLAHGRGSHPRQKSISAAIFADRDHSEYAASRGNSKENDWHSHVCWNNRSAWKILYPRRTSCDYVRPRHVIVMEYAGHTWWLPKV